MAKQFSRQEVFVSQYYDDAIKNQIDTGIPYQVTLAQAALESGWGKHAPGNNFFGVKAFKSWKGKTQQLLTTENVNGDNVKVTASFRVYETSYESFKDHADVLKRRFPVALQYKTNPEEFIRSVQRDHGYKYATDPFYVPKIISIMALIKQVVNDLKLNNKNTKR